MRRLTPLALLTLLAVPACRDLAPIEPTGRCGDGVLEPEVGEDCDTYAIGEATTCGAPGTPAACRYTCADAACPADWRCGRDAICRAPSGAFSAAGPLALDGETVLPGDVDGDGLTDLILAGNATITTAFGDTDGRFTRAVTIPAGIQDEQIYVGNITADGRTDVLVPTPEGIRIYRGESRRLSPVAFPVAHLTDLPGEAQIIGLRVGPGPNPFALVVVNDGVALRAVLIGAESTDTSALADALTGIPGPPLLTALPGPPARVALHIAGGDTLFILSIRCRRRTCTLDVDQRIDAPEQMRFGELPPVIGDVNGDGVTDLVVNYNIPTTHVGFIESDDGVPFARRALVDWPLQDSPQCRLCGTAGFTTTADALGDALPDFAGPGGIFRTLALDPLDLEAIQLDLRGGIRRAQFVDLNRDGHEDVVALRDGSQVDLVLSDGVQFYPHIADVDGDARQFRIGDFDGDLFPDVAVLESGERVAVFFADPLGLPRERVLMLDAPGVVDIDLDPPRGANATGLWALRATDTPGDWLVVSFASSSTRRMSAPLVGSNSSHLTVPLALGGETALLIAGRALGNDNWIFERAHPGATLGETLPTLQRTPLDCPIPIAHSLAAATADLDGDGDDALVVIGAPGPDYQETGAPWPVRLIELGGTCHALDLDRDLLPPADPVFEDLDGDGALDLAVTTRHQPQSRRADTPAEAVPTLVVWWGDGQGGLTPTPDRYPGVEHFTPFTLGRTGPRPLAALTLGPDGARTIELLSLADRTLTPLHPITTLAPTDDAVTRLIALDAEGDGLDDLLVHAGDLQLYRHRPCDAAEAATGACTRRAP